MALKDVLKKATNLFIVPEPALSGGEGEELSAFFEGMKTTPAEAAALTPGPSMTEVRLPDGVQAATSDGVDFATIYEAANLPKIAFSVEQTIGLIDSLPSTMTTDLKRQTVLASIASMGGVMGVTARDIVADCARKLAALNAYVEQNESTTRLFVGASSAEIERLQAQIEEHKRAIQDAQVRAEQTRSACDAEADRIDNLFDYLGRPDGSPTDESSSGDIGAAPDPPASTSGAVPAS